MARAVKAALSGCAALVAILIIGGLIAQLVFAPAGNDRTATWGMAVYMVWTLSALVVPSYVTGFVNRKGGTFFGLVFAAITMALLALVWSNTPWIVFAAFLLVAVASGYAGGIRGRRTSARPSIPPSDRDQNV